MSESSSTSFPRFGSEQIRNLHATELITGSREMSQSTMTRAHTDHGEVSASQVSPADSRGDSQPDQSSLIRDLIRDELRRSLGRRSRHLES